MHLRAKQAYLGEYKTLPVCSVFNVEKRSDQNVRSGKRIRCLGPIVGFSRKVDEAWGSVSGPFITINKVAFLYHSETDNILNIIKCSDGFAYIKGGC